MSARCPVCTSRENNEPHGEQVLPSPPRVREEEVHDAVAAYQVRPEDRARREPSSERVDYVTTPSFPTATLASGKCYARTETSPCEERIAWAESLQTSPSDFG